jgi:hypothetical protein
MRMCMCMCDAHITQTTPVGLRRQKRENAGVLDHFRVLGCTEWSARGDDEYFSIMYAVLALNFLLRSVFHIV